MYNNMLGVENYAVHANQLEFEFESDRANLWFSYFQYHAEWESRLVISAAYNLEEVNFFGLNPRTIKSIGTGNSAE